MNLETAEGNASGTSAAIMRTPAPDVDKVTERAEILPGLARFPHSSKDPIRSPSRVSSLLKHAAGRRSVKTFYRAGQASLVTAFAGVLADLTGQGVLVRGRRTRGAAVLWPNPAYCDLSER